MQTGDGAYAPRVAMKKKSRSRLRLSLHINPHTRHRGTQNSPTPTKLCSSILAMCQDGEAGPSLLERVACRDLDRMEHVADCKNPRGSAGGNVQGSALSIEFWESPAGLVHTKSGIPVPIDKIQREISLAVRLVNGGPSATAATLASEVQTCMNRIPPVFPIPDHIS